MNTTKNKISDLSEGDIFYTQSNTKFNLYKLLAIDTEIGCYHILSYSQLDNLPLIEDLEKLPVFIYHSPFDKKAFPDVTFLVNKPINSADLVGYHEYLRQTKAPNDYIPIANNYYKSGLRLTDDKRYHEAIDSYSKAIDLFPQFFEAIDNRAFCKMDMGLWVDAIKDFELSLQQNPKSLLVEFSIGECYFKMGDYVNAKRQFEIAHEIDSNHQAPIQFLAKIHEILKQIR